MVTVSVGDESENQLSGLAHPQRQCRMFRTQPRGRIRFLTIIGTNRIEEL
jgi:hypothetical protein